MRSQLSCSCLIFVLFGVLSSNALRINQVFDEDPVSINDVGGREAETTTVNVVVNQDVVDEGGSISFDDSSNADSVVETTTFFNPEGQVGQEDQFVPKTEDGGDGEVVDDGFRYPAIPAVLPEEDVGFTTVKPVPDDFDIAQLENINNAPGIGVHNGTRVVVGINGRASCACGIPQPRIVGGRPESINKLPWTAALVRGGINTIGRPYCGGTLINSRYVVTASHCVDGMNARGISVRLNQENVYSSPAVQSFGVSRIIMHPNYNRGTIDNDIALVQLSQPVQLTRNSPVVPACLPAAMNINIDDYEATAAGWGATAQGGSTSSVLNRVEVPIISNEKCNRDTKYLNRITENMLCAGRMEGGKDSCQGDSGGPLIIQNGNRGTLVGIVSWGYGCAQAKAPGVYARVSRYPDWILSNTRDADWCDG